jgi:hypothetical protein
LWFADRSAIFDHFGPGFTLLRLPGRTSDTRAIQSAATKRNVPLKIVEVALPDARDLYGAGFALVRPDQHVAWRGDALPDDCEGLLARVTGW